MSDVNQRVKCDTYKQHTRILPDGEIYVNDSNFYDKTFREDTMSTSDIVVLNETPDPPLIVNSE